MSVLLNLPQAWKEWQKLKHLTRGAVAYLRKLSVPFVISQMANG